MKLLTLLTIALISSSMLFILGWLKINSRFLEENPEIRRLEDMEQMRCLSDKMKLKHGNLM